MSRSLLFGLLLIVAFLSCGKRGYLSEMQVNSEMTVEIITLIQDSTLNVRALDISKDDHIYFAGSKGEIGGIYKYTEDSLNPSIVNKHTAEIITRLQDEDRAPNFRSISRQKERTFTLSIGSPALLFRTQLGNSKIVYTETHEKAFYDSMAFWNDQEGIAIGDPTDDCMSIIITRDGGNTWNRLACDNLPRAREGEAAFAASDTNIAIINDHTWVATGGMASRILYSPDKGRTWEVFETPIVQDRPTTGMYSLDFHDKKNGFAIGGDYTRPADNSANKIRTQDGGKTWQLVAKNQSPGYRSCIQYIPNGGAEKLVAVGFEGIDYSADAGNTWQHLSDEGFYTVRFLNDSVAFAGGNGRVAKVVFRESENRFRK